MLGATGGEEAHTSTLTETAAHGHTLDWNLLSNTATTGTANRAASIVGPSGGTNTSNTAGAGGNGAHNNVQPTMVLNYLIFAGCDPPC